MHLFFLYVVFLFSLISFLPPALLCVALEATIAFTALSFSFGNKQKPDLKIPIGSRRREVLIRSTEVSHQNFIEKSRILNLDPGSAVVPVYKRFFALANSFREIDMTLLS